MAEEVNNLENENLSIEGLDDSFMQELEDTFKTGDLSNDNEDVNNDKLLENLEKNEDEDEDENEEKLKDKDKDKDKPKLISKKDIDNEESEFQVIADFLKDEGLFDDSDLENEEFKFDGTKDGLIKAVTLKSQREAESMVDELIEDMPSKLKAQVKSYLEGLEEEQALDFGDKISYYDSLTDEELESNPHKAEQVYRELLKSKNFSEAKIEKYVNRAKEMDEIVEEGKDAAKELKSSLEEKAEAEKVRIKEAEKLQKIQAKERIEKIKSDILNRTSFGDGLPMSDKIKQKVIDSIINPSAKDGKGNPLNEIQALFQKNPLETAIMLNYYKVLGLFNYDDKTQKYKPDLSQIANVKESKIVDTITNKLKGAANKIKNNKSGFGGYDVADKTTSETIKAIEKLFVEE